MNADGLPHGFEVARSCVGKCLSAHRAMWQPQARILEPNGKRSSMASSTLFRRSTQWIHQICLESVGFFPRNGPKDNHEIKDLINSFYTICIKIFGCLSKNPYLKNHQKKKTPAPSHLIPESTTRPRPPRPPRKGEALVFSTAQLPDITRRLAARRLVIHPW